MDVAGMVLCAGLGTRLRPLTLGVPKPAVPVCGVPLVRFSLALLRAAGVRRAVVNVHHLADAMASAAAGAARSLGMELAVSREPVIAGTGGALREARRHLASADAILVLNGDVLLDVDLAAALDAHRRSGALATMVLLPMPAGARYAAVEVDGGGAVRRIAGRFGPGGEGLAPWHFSGAHVLSPGILDRVAAEPFEVDVNRHVYPPLMASGAVRGLVVDARWSDLGAPASYLGANLDVLSGGFPVSRFPGADPFEGTREVAPLVRAGPGAIVDPGARLEGPALVLGGAVVEAGAEVGPRAVVGPGCVVPHGARVRDAVLWEGTRLARGETVEGAIASGGIRVGRGAP
ncbi:MAG TPA: NDP-sugar synthase [Anaeromyxobacteraceae bacterium]|nr:NDP-sugar synthase [Anaeromyxobacteraceae bacterium]